MASAGKPNPAEWRLRAMKAAPDKDAGVVIGDYTQQRALLTDVKRDSAS
jgi:hypothetical protein